MRILVACEYSGRVRDEFIKLGHDAISCDLLPTELPGPHIQGNVLPLLQQRWDLVVAHPPCTRLCNSGVRWLHERNLWNDLELAAIFFKACLYANSSRVAVENPVMHKYARERIGRNYDFSVQPYEHGDPYTKRTCFWTRGLPPIGPTKLVEGRVAEVHKSPPCQDRAKRRSLTYPGIAFAIAKTWG